MTSSALHTKLLIDICSVVYYTYSASWAYLVALMCKTATACLRNNKTVYRTLVTGRTYDFDYVFISEQLGTKKPEKDFYDKVFAQIGESRRKSALMVGDSLSSDMQGGRNAGIPTCFYGTRENADERCDYVIEDLLDLLPILKNS